MENAQLVIWPDRIAGSLGAPDLDDAAARQAAGMLALGTTGTIHLGRQGEQRGDDVSVFVQSYVPPPRMIIFGAIDFAAAMARIGTFLGYHVTVCDARPVFATRARFPDADDLVVQWPHTYLESTTIDDRTVLCVLTHDPKFDVPLLQVALLTPARYIGAMGSRRAHDDRMRRLREAGVGEARAGPALLADRPGPGCADAGGDGRGDRRRDHRAGLGRFRSPAQRTRHPDPPRRLT